MLKVINITYTMDDGSTTHAEIANGECEQWGGTQENREKMKELSSAILYTATNFFIEKGGYNE